MIINLHTDISFAPKEAAYDEFVADLEELNIRRLRVPIRERELMTADGKANEAAIGRINEFIDGLPRRIAAHGYIYSLSDQMMDAYLYGEASFSDRWGEAISEIVPRLSERFQSFEIWNEPNVSWSYLSRLEEGATRPWRPMEFCNTVLLPGLRSLRACAPKAAAVVGALSDDGMVGHPKKRKPSFSGQFRPQHPVRLEAIKSERAPFYVFPNFLARMGKGLTENRDLFDAVAFHPYPYFSRGDDESLIDCSIRKLANARKAMNEIGLEDAPIWVTETGAREHDPGRWHFYYPEAPAEFLSAVSQYIEANNDALKVEEFFLYKYADSPRDLDQEKLFGLLDISGTERSVFHVVKTCNDRQLSSFVHRRALKKPEVSQTLYEANPEKGIYCYFASTGQGTLAAPGRGPDAIGRIVPAYVLPARRVMFRVSVINHGSVAKGRGRMMVSLGADGAEAAEITLKFDPDWIDVTGPAGPLGRAPRKENANDVVFEVSNGQLAMTLNGETLVAKDLPCTEIRDVRAANAGAKATYLFERMEGEALNDAPRAPATEEPVSDEAPADDERSGKKRWSLFR